MFNKKTLFLYQQYHISEPKKYQVRRSSNFLLQGGRSQRGRFKLNQTHTPQKKNYHRNR